MPTGCLAGPLGPAALPSVPLLPRAAPDMSRRGEPALLRAACDGSGPLGGAARAAAPNGPERAPANSGEQGPRRHAHRPLASASPALGDWRRRAGVRRDRTSSVAGPVGSCRPMRGASATGAAPARSSFTQPRPLSLRMART